MTGRELPPTSAFAGDDGAADPALHRALQAWAARPGSLPEVVAALRDARVLVPVVTRPDRSTAAVALPAPDGRTALPVFSEIGALIAWHPDARPVPTPAAQAAAAALAEGWELMVLDAAGPVTVVVPAPAVRALATGTAWEPAVSGGVVRGDVAEAVQRAALVRHVSSVQVLPGDSAEVAVVLGVRPGLDRDALERLLAGVGRRLATAEVAAQVDSLELRVERAVSAEAPADAAPAPARAARAPRRAARPAPPG